MQFSYFIEGTVPRFDEISVIGKNLEKDGRFCHIIGMARQGEEAKLYVIERMEEEKELPILRKRKKHTNRARLKESHDMEYFGRIESLEIGGQDFQMSQMTGGCIDIEGFTYEPGVFVLAEFVKTGWNPPEELMEVDWKQLHLVKIIFKDSVIKLPDWKTGGMRVTMRLGHKEHFIEKRVRLKIENPDIKSRSAKKLTFSLPDGREGICYINRVYLMDVWKDQEERFQDPRYIERLTPEQLEKAKKMCFEALEETCPKGMYFTCIEYECEPDMQLMFYAGEFLKAGPHVSKGSAHMMLIMLKPDEPAGPHGLKQHGCVLQTPLAGDTKEQWAELFCAVEQVPGWTEQIM